jgi:hypothetical protein
MVAERVARIKQKYAFDIRPPHEKRYNMPCAQMKLGWDVGAASTELQGMPSLASG